MPRLTKYDKKMIEFNKRYDKFKKYNLPAPFWDEERQTFEYVLFESDPWRENQLVVTPNLYNAFENIIWDNFYYSFDCRHYESYIENNKWVHKEVIGHIHEHDFDAVLRWVYEFPETFNISEEDEQFYSKQELRFIKHLQNYLLLMGVKDLKYNERRTTRCRNARRKKYEKAFIRKYPDELVKAILDGEVNYVAYPYKEGYELKNYKRGESRALVMNSNEKYVFALEFGKSELKDYREVKKYYKLDLKDDDKVIVNYFKILEKF